MFYRIGDGMEFKIKADAVFEAIDIDDAFIKIAQHFIHMYTGEDSTLISEGRISIEPNKK
jgi:hypothetical protein